MSFDSILHVAALVLFLVGSAGVATGRTTAAGLACWVATYVV